MPMMIAKSPLGLGELEDKLPLKKRRPEHSVLRLSRGGKVLRPSEPRRRTAKAIANKVNGLIPWHATTALCFNETGKTKEENPWSFRCRSTHSKANSFLESALWLTCRA
jgi:hypothetical protein